MVTGRDDSADGFICDAAGRTGEAIGDSVDDREVGIDSATHAPRLRIIPSEIVQREIIQPKINNSGQPQDFANPQQTRVPIRAIASHCQTGINR